jgi:hypothetical protein
MDIDLDIDNYDMDELLSIFKLKYDFNMDDLKSAKKTALKTHPDKSGLDKKYFIFFSKAYNIIYNIYRFRNKIHKKVSNVDYINDEINEGDRMQLMKKINKFDTVKEFNDWFNDVFEKVKIPDDKQEGYGEWFKSNEDLDETEISNVSEMTKVFNKKKQQTKALVKHMGIRELADMNNGSNLSRKKPEYYESGLFSNLKYEDLKKAHTETVVPVTMDDFNDREHFSNLNDLKQHRDTSIDEPISLNQSKKYLIQREKDENIINTNRAFELLKEEDKMKESNNQFWSYLRQLQN